MDMYPRTDFPRNFLFRGDNPVSNQTFNLSSLFAALRTAAGKCGENLPEDFQFVDVDLENLSDPGYAQEIHYWRTHPGKGRLLKWPLLGSLRDVQHSAARDTLVASGEWAIEGSADHLEERLAATRSLLINSSRPTIIFAHCNAGCDRTGEFIGSYMMSYLGYNITTAMGEPMCPRCALPTRLLAVAPGARPT